jgi:di/tricarboxylate transporter
MQQIAAIEERLSKRCLMAGALRMILLQIFSVDEAYRFVGWRTIFILARIILRGIATKKTVTGAYIAHKTP